MQGYRLRSGALLPFRAAQNARWPKYPVKPSILDLYRQDRAAATTEEERETVWRIYAIAVLQEFSEEHRQLAPPSIRWRSRKDDRDKLLPVRCKPMWRRFTDDELRALWLALERAKYTPSECDEE